MELSPRREVWLTRGRAEEHFLPVVACRAFDSTNFKVGHEIVLSLALLRG